MNIHAQIKLVEALQNRDIRVENIQFLPACTSGDAFNDIIETLLVDSTGEDLRQIVGGGKMFDAIATLIDGPSPFGEDEAFVDLDRHAQRALLSGYFGTFQYQTDWPTFLVQVATPVRDYVDPSGNGYSYSWGYYTTQWVAGQTLRDVLKHVLKWHSERVASWEDKSATRAA